MDTYNNPQNQSKCILVPFQEIAYHKKFFLVTIISSKAAHLERLDAAILAITDVQCSLELNETVGYTCTKCLNTL